MSAQAHGFRLSFTQMFDVGTVVTPKSYTLKSYTYPYQSRYGGEPVDVKTHEVKFAGLDALGLFIDLAVDEMREGYVYELHARGVRDHTGRPLLHPEACLPEPDFEVATYSRLSLLKAISLILN